METTKKNAREIICKLKFISKIKLNEKIKLSDNSIQELNWYSKIYRTFYHKDENKELTCNFINEIIDEAIACSKECLNYNNDNVMIDLGKEIINELKNSKNGITSLSNTYKDHSLTKSKLEGINNYIDICRKDIINKNNIEK